MRLLLDTCTFLWIIAEYDRLSDQASRALVDSSNEVYLSPLAVWEIALKYGRGTLKLAQPPELIVPKYRAAYHIETLPIVEDAVLHLRRLPRHHNDPFDRMLVCQAISEGMAIVTPDVLIRQYPVNTLW